VFVAFPAVRIAHAGVQGGVTTVKRRPQNGYSGTQMRFSFLIPFWALSLGFLRVARHPPRTLSMSDLAILRLLTKRKRSQNR
jgi:hypothetical protein